MDAITLLKNDHKEVEKLFKRFEKAGEKAYAQKRSIVEKISEELSKHAAIEEQLFYPVIRATVEKTEDMALESLEEHHIVKWVLSELEDMDPKDERYVAKVTVLMENVRHHVEEEEQDLFPDVRDGLSRKDLADLGEAMEKAKDVAPTHPHPRLKDTPPANLVAGAVAAVVDRVTDTVSGAAQGTVAAAEDVIAEIRGRRNGSRASAPTGTTTAKRTARKTRAAANQVAKKATSAAKRNARPAKRTAKKQTRKATAATKSTAKRAQRTTRQAAKATKTTAKSASNNARKAASSTKSTAKRAATNARKASSSRR